MTYHFFFQNLRIQRSVGRAREGTTFPLSLKLKVNFPVEDSIPVQDAPEPEPGADASEHDVTSLPADCSFSATIWVFTTISGLITVQTDGKIYGINNTFSLMLFGYEKKELLGKVTLLSFFSLVKEMSLMSLCVDMKSYSFVQLRNNVYSIFEC